MLKTKLTLIVSLLFVAVLVGNFLWRAGNQVPAIGRTLETGPIAVGGPYALTDQNGKPRSSDSFQGKYQLIYFGYSYCPDVCPTTLALMAAALEKLGADKDRIVPVFITIDPKRDTPSVLKKYMAAFGPGFVGLTGTPDEIERVEKEFHVYAKKHPLPGGNYSLDHSSVIYLLGPDGKLVGYFDDAVTPDDLVKDIRQKI
jgi:protein SCO1/2